MALTATLVTNTNNRLIFSITHNGAAGNTLTITNAALQAAAAGLQPLLGGLQKAVVDSAAAVRLLLGGQPIAARISGTGGANINQWTIDASAAAGLAQLDVAAEDQVASQAVLDVVFLHSLTR